VIDTQLKMTKHQNQSALIIVMHTIVSPLITLVKEPSHYCSSAMIITHACHKLAVQLKKTSCDLTTYFQFCIE